jgi:hypothetical protein
MAQNISNTNNFTTNYDTGVPDLIDEANIVQAFIEYHYGANYNGSGSPGGIEGHLSSIDSDIVTHVLAETGVHGVGSGSVVGTTLAQILTNKTIDSPIITGSANVSGNINVTGRLDVQEIRESLSDGSLSSGTLIINYTNGSNTFLSSPDSNFTINLTNVPTDNNKIINVSVIVSQGATARIPGAFQIDGSVQTIRWVGGITPTGTSNKINIFSFTLIRQSNTWVVLAQSSLNF